MNCCNQDCVQGRQCPVRQACELPEPTPRPRQFEPTYDLRGPYTRAPGPLRRLAAAIASFFIR